MVRIYVCGPTVYDKPHIGNFRPIVTVDIYARAMKKLGHKVHLSHNITDVDDKIIARASYEKTTEKAVSTRFFKLYKNLLDKLNVTTVNDFPFVTMNLESIITFIEKLVALKYAYLDNGNVFFDTAKVPEYGFLSKQLLPKIMSRNRPSPRRNAYDFAIWKKTTTGTRFASPWGRGRPGWHTECAALIAAIYKGRQLDLHSGGIDLVFPHHENENAQFKAIYQTNIARTWKHIGHLSYKTSKMSKSIGNIIDADAFIKKHGADTLRMIFLSSSPTKPLDIDDSIITNGVNNVQRIRRAYFLAQLTSIKAVYHKEALAMIRTWRFPQFTTLLVKTVKNFNTNGDLKSAQTILSMAEMAGFHFTQRVITSSDQQLYDQWQTYRRQRLYKEADAIRTVLQKKELI